MKPDVKDIFLFGGLGMLAYGFYQLDPAFAFVIVGSILFCLGLFFYVRK